MKILLVAIHPLQPSIRFGRSLAIATLAASLRSAYDSAGCQVILRDFYPTEFSCTDLLKDLLAVDADMVGFSSYIWNADLVLEVVQKLRESRPGSTIIAGGPQVVDRNWSREMLAGGATALVMGEGELTLVDLVGRLRNKVPFDDCPGLLLLRGEELVTTPAREPVPDLTTLPSPIIWETLDPSDEPVILWELGRGCNYRCKYCYDHRGFGQGVRHIPLSRLSEELRILCASPPALIDLVDSTFNWDTVRAVGILGMIAEAAPDQRFLVEVRPELLTREVAALLCEGRFKIYCGLQTITHSVAAAVGRPLDRESVVRGLNLILGDDRRRNCVAVDLIYGLPGDGYQGLLDSIDFCLECHVDVISINPLLILPGTRLAEEAPTLGIEAVPSGRLRGHARNIPGLPEEDLRRCQDIEELHYVLRGYPRHFPILPHFLARWGVRMSALLRDWVDSKPCGRSQHPDPDRWEAACWDAWKRHLASHAPQQDHELIDEWFDWEELLRSRDGFRCRRHTASPTPKPASLAPGPGVLLVACKFDLSELFSRQAPSSRSGFLQDDLPAGGIVLFAPGVDGAWARKVEAAAENAFIEVVESAGGMLELATWNGLSGAQLAALLGPALCEKLLREGAAHLA